MNFILPLLPNRVWRTYKGGKILDEIEASKNPHDDHFPEDWIGSVTRAVNTGRENLVEGISSIEIENKKYSLTDWINRYPEEVLGKDHLQAFGKKVMVLSKFLDASIRLHVQCHPTIAFSQKHLQANSGKTEVYHILKIREDQPNPYLYLGFQNPPSPERLREIILNQEVEALENCFEKIPVTVGDTFFVPGGLPHAIGEGVLMVEIMEPTDFVSRFEFERGGYRLPEAARFMGRDIDFGLAMLDSKPIPVPDVLKNYRVAHSGTSPGDHSCEVLIGPKQTNCFGIRKYRITKKTEIVSDTFTIDIVTQGSGTLRSPEMTSNIQCFDRFFVPHSLRSYEFIPNEPTEILSITPPLHSSTSAK